MLVSTNFRLCGMRDEYAETKIIMKKETKGLEDEELNRAITEFNKRVKPINREIREELLLLCLKQKPKWIAVDDIDSIRLLPLGCKSKLPIFERELRRLVPLCVPVDTDNIVNNTPFGEYGNCILCYKKGRLNKRCGRDPCRNHIFGRIMIFTNLQGYYINPDLIETVLKNEEGDADVNKEELLCEEDSVSYDVCLPLECDEYILKPFYCTFKLLWYAHMYDEYEVNNLKHVMNEVVTTYDVMSEIYLVHN